MHQSGHLGINLIVFAPVALGLAWMAATRVLTVGLHEILLTSTAPDFDEFVPHLAHRGVTHTLHAAVISDVVCGIVAPLVVRSGTGSEAATGG